MLWTSRPRTCAGCFLNDFPATTWDDVRLQSVASVVQLAVPVRVRHERDPYLYFLDISDGRGDFGLKTSEKVRRCTAATGVPCLTRNWPTSLAHCPVWWRSKRGLAVSLSCLTMHSCWLTTSADVLCCAADHRLHAPGARHRDHPPGLRCAPPAV